MPSITYLSDIHLEFYKKTIPFGMDLKEGDILCLAGDIGDPESELYYTFLNYCRPLFKHIFIIAGNHEYYRTTSHPNKTIQSTNEKIAAICQEFPNVHFLNNTTYYIPEFDTYVLGTTLWSTTTGEHDEVYTYNDFRKIHNMNLPQYMDRLHEMSLAYLKGELEKISATSSISKVVVMTHHMPSHKLIHPTYADSDISHLFATNLEHLMYTYHIDHWICGHSHNSVNMDIHKTKIWMNPIGYPGEHKNKTMTWNSSFKL